MRRLGVDTSRGQLALLVLVLMLALVSSAAAAATAQAASVVYVQDGNVWLAGLDGSGQYQVTGDGSVSNPYTSPSQADDGTIVAARAKELYRMKQNGVLLNAPFGTASPFGAIINPRVSPDGTKVGFSFVTVVPGFQTKRATLYTYSDRFTDASVFGRQDSLRFSSWITNTRVLGHFGTQAIFDDMGGGDNSYTDWFFESDYGASPAVNLNDGEVSPAGDRMAIVRADDPDTTGGVIYLYGVNAIVPRGQPGATPTPACAISGAGGAAVVYHRPTWAPDGLSLVWDEPDGLHAAQVPATALEANGTNCGEITERLIVPGGATPDVGPAEVAPGPRGGTGPSGSAPPGRPGTGTGGRGGGTGASGTKITPIAVDFAFVGRRSLRALRTSGLSFRVKCQAACEVTGQLLLRGRPVASGRRTLTSAGTATVKVKTSKAGKRALRRLRRAKLTLRVQIKNRTSGSTSTFSKTLTLKR